MDRHRGADIDLALDPEGAAMDLDQALGERQAQSSLLSSWRKGARAAGRSSAAMPMPVSLIASTMPPPASSGPRSRIVTVTVPPVRVNLTAFERRLSSICRSFPSSAQISGRSGGKRVSILMSAASARSDTSRSQRTTIVGDYGLGFFENDGKGDKILEMTV